MILIPCLILQTLAVSAQNLSSLHSSLSSKSSSDAFLNASKITVSKASFDTPSSNASKPDIYHFDTYNDIMTLNMKMVSRSVSMSKSSSISPFSKRDIGTVTLSGNKVSTLFAYNGQVSVGTPAQNFNILFDTGSFQFWVRSSLCNTTLCRGQRSFNGNRSSTYSTARKVAEPINYLDGSSVQAYVANDNVGTSSLSVKNFTFLEAFSTDAGTNETDGIMGLSFAPTSANPTFISALAEQKTLTSNVFSYFIDTSETGGGLTFGGVDINRYNGDLTWLSVMDATPAIFWQVSLNALKVGSTSISLPSSFGVVLDTGTSLAVFPSDVAARINKEVGFSLLSSSAGIYGTICRDGKIPSNLPNIVLSFEGVAFSFQPNEYIFTTTDDRGTVLCVSGIQGLPLSGSAVSSSASSRTAIVGNVLLRKLYLVHDFSAKKVGVANANRETGVRGDFRAASSTNSPKGLASNVSPNSKSSASHVSRGVSALIGGVAVLSYLLL